MVLNSASFNGEEKQGEVHRRYSFRNAVHILGALAFSKLLEVTVIEQFCQPTICQHMSTSLVSLSHGVVLIVESFINEFTVNKGPLIAILTSMHGL